MPHTPHGWRKEGASLVEVKERNIIKRATESRLHFHFAVKVFPEGLMLTREP